MALPLYEAITVTLVPIAQEMQQLAGKQMQHHNLAALMAWRMNSYWQLSS